MTASKQKIVETMASIDNINRAQSNPYLYEKVMQRLNTLPAKVTSIKPSLIWAAAACLVLLFGLNLFTCIDYSKTNNHLKSTKDDAAATSIAKDYFSTDNVPQF